MTNRVAILVVLCAALAAAGCGGNAGEHNPEGDMHGGHAHAAPRGGALIVLAEETAHVEMTFDPTTGTVDLYALGPHASTPVRLSAPKITLHLYRDGEAILMHTEPVASDLTGETVGDTSQYRGQDDRLIGADSFRGDLKNIEVRGVNRETVAVRWPPQ